jgi:VIT1/CCC1 family predicted Fe2+/Mn2+ transporter
MAGAYACGATVPLLPFAVAGGWVALGAGVLLTALSLFALGVGKAAASDQRRIRSGVEMLVLASAAGLLGYLVGLVARAAFGLDV